MFFLVPYSLIDREDLSVIQKMCILYLARHYDENGVPPAINEEELAEKLRVSTGEIKLNLEVLASKGILASESERRASEPIFAKIDEFILDELVAGGAFSDEEETAEEGERAEASESAMPPDGGEELGGAGEETRKEAGESPPLLERGEEHEEDEGERELNELLSRVSDVEKRIRERASRLRVKVRKKKKEADGTPREAEERAPHYRRRDSDLIEEAPEVSPELPIEEAPELPPDADEIESLKAQLRSIELDVEEGEVAALKEEASGGRRTGLKDAYAFYEAGADGKMHFPKEYQRTKEMIEANELLEYLASSGIDRAGEKKKRLAESEMPSMRRRVLGDESEEARVEEEERKKPRNPKFMKASSIYQQNAIREKKNKTKKQEEKEV